MSEKFSDRASDTGNDSPRTDWSHLGNRSDDDIDAAIAGDEDTFALTPADLRPDGPGFRFVACDNDRWCWHFYGESGKLLAQSGQTYPTVIEAISAADQIRRSFAKAA